MLSIKNLRVRIKLLLIIGSALVGIITLVSMSLLLLRQDILREKELKTQHVVETAHSVVGLYQKMAAEGKIPPQQAKSMALEAVKAMRYGENGYFWINDMQPKMIMHPIQPELDGKNLTDRKDVAGKRFIVTCVETVKAHGAGFVYYYKPKPGFDKPVQKLSYVKGFAPWGWIIGSGIYLDDVNAIFWRSARDYALAGVAVFLLITAISVVVAGNIARTEESLRLSEEKFYKAFQASPDCYSISRKKDGLYIEANEAFFRTTGYSREEIIGHSSLDIGIWADPAQRSQMIERIEREGGLRNIEARQRTKSGEVRSLLCSCDLITLKGEECIILIKRDVTDKKAKERQLLKGKAELIVKLEQLSILFKTVESIKMDWERTMDCIDDQVIMLDSQGRVKRYNRSSAKFIGLPVEKIIALDWSKFAQSAGMPPLGTNEHCAEYYHKDLNRWFCCTYYPGGTEGRGELGAVITIHDMTESKLAAMEIGKAYDELKVTQSQMIQQEKMASIGQLAAGVAHEINNPTGFVMSNLGTLGKYAERLIDFVAAQADTIGRLGSGEETERIAALHRQLKIKYIIDDLPKLVNESLEGTERVKTIVQNMKSFSRQDQSQSELTDLRECIESTINIVWNELKYKVTLNREYAELPPLRCYPQQLSQVIMNLLVNAGHAIETRGEITVRTWLQDGAACIAISDTGCGISEEHRARIFEPFFTTKEVGKGTGLGLSISFNIVKKHGGDIAVESEVGKGTIFTVTLPLDVQSV
jgi:two-component system NtrC family sensor kinase